MVWADRGKIKNLHHMGVKMESIFQMRWSLLLGPNFCILALGIRIFSLTFYDFGALCILAPLDQRRPVVQLHPCTPWPGRHCS